MRGDGHEVMAAMEKVMMADTVKVTVMVMVIMMATATAETMTDLV